MHDHGQLNIDVCPYIPCSWLGPYGFRWNFGGGEGGMERNHVFLPVTLVLRSVGPAC